MATSDDNTNLTMNENQPTIKFSYFERSGQTIIMDSKEQAEKTLCLILERINAGDKAFMVTNQRIVSLENIRSVQVSVYIPEKPSYRFQEG